MPFNLNNYLYAIQRGDLKVLKEQLAFAIEERIDSQKLSAGFVELSQLSSMETTQAHLDFVLLLKQFGADVNFTFGRQNNLTPIATAASNGNCQMLEALAVQGGMIDFEMARVAVDRGHFDCFKFIMTKLSASLSNEEKNRLLRRAMSHGSTNIVSFLLNEVVMIRDCATIPDFESIKFATSILRDVSNYANNKTSSEWLELLYLTATNHQRNCPANSDLDWGFLRSAKLVLQKARSTDFSAKELQFNEKEFYAALVTCHILNVTAVFANAPDDIINRPTLNGETPLLIAIKSTPIDPRRKKPMINYLLRRGASVEVRDHEGKSVLECAKTQGLDQETMRWLQNPVSVRGKTEATSTADSSSAATATSSSGKGGVGSPASMLEALTGKKGQDYAPSAPDSVIPGSSAGGSKTSAAPTGPGSTASNGTNDNSPKISYRGLKILGLVVTSLIFLVCVVTIPFLFITIPVLADAVRNPDPSKGERFYGRGYSQTLLNPQFPHSKNHFEQLRVRSQHPAKGGYAPLDTGLSVTPSPIAAPKPGSSSANSTSTTTSLAAPAAPPL